MKITRLMALVAGFALVSVSVAMSQMAPAVPVAPAAPTIISVGTIAGEVLAWVAAAFALPIGTVLTMWLMRMFKLAGVQVDGAMKTQLQGIVVNGLNAAAANAAANARGLGQVELKNKVVRDAVAYVQDHGAETIKALGLDPNSGTAVEVIKARIETAIVDPTQPTPVAVEPDVRVQRSSGSVGQVPHDPATRQATGF